MEGALIKNGVTFGRCPLATYTGVSGEIFRSKCLVFSLGGYLFAKQVWSVRFTHWTQKNKTMKKKRGRPEKPKSEKVRQFPFYSTERKINEAGGLLAVQKRIKELLN